jgi:acyl-CoA thioesterase
VHDIGLDTAVSGLNGRYTANLAEGWEVWGPQGGYVAAVALRGAEAADSFRRPVSFACHFLRAAQVGRVDIRVESLRRTKRAESLRVALLQEGVALLEALVWTVDELVGIEARMLVVVADSAMYPAATFAHDEAFPYVAPSLDLVMSFHRSWADSEWLLVEGTSPLSESALVAGRAAIWSRDGRLLASATQQMLQRQAGS